MNQRVEIIGRVGQSPDLKYTNTGKAVCNFSVATSETWKDAQGAKQEKTTWFRVAAWGKLAEVCNTYVHKGMLVNVAGTVEARAYMNNAGQAAASLELTAKTVLFLTRANGDGERVGRDEYGSLEHTPQTADDIPF